MSATAVGAAAPAEPRDIDRYRGLNASMALPMTADFRPDIASLREYAHWLVRQGVVGVTVNADTGEGAHLTVEERIEVVRAVKDEVGDEAKVVSGLISAYTDQAVELATALQGAGADALLVFGIPAFNGRPLPPDLVYAYFEAVGAVGTPLIAFNLTPALGGVVFEPDVISRLADVAPLHALKEASFDAAAYVRTRDALRSASSDVALLSGCDNFMYESFVLGAEGALLGYAGLAAELTRLVFDAVAAGRLEEAERLNRERMQPLAEVLFGPPVRNSRARIKEGLKLLGVLDETAVRPPLLPLDAVERSALRVAMERAELL